MTKIILFYSFVPLQSICIQYTHVIIRVSFALILVKLLSSTFNKSAIRSNLNSKFNLLECLKVGSPVPGYLYWVLYKP